MNQLVNFSPFSMKKSLNFPIIAKTLSLMSLAFVCAGMQNTNAATFEMPQGTDSLVDSNQGKPVYVRAKQEDSLIDIAVQKLLGQEEIVLANKKVDRWLPKAGTQIRIPSSYLLPDAPRQGVVINLPEYRLYYYVPSKEPKEVVKTVKDVKEVKDVNDIKTSPLEVSLDAKPEIKPEIKEIKPIKVISYSVGIGRVDWKTPLGVTNIVGKVKNPTWTPPPSIKAEHLAKGDPLPDVWPAGPDNPLGLFAFRLGIPGYLLHSTNKPQGVGMQVSHGCMRLYPKDIEQLFPLLPVGTKVNIINQPIKVGWSNGKLYLEVHPLLEGEESPFQQRLDSAMSLIEKANATQLAAINEAVVKTAGEASDGIPVVISKNGAALDAKPSSATDDLGTDSVLKSQIERELKQEELQEREFNNSPFPRH